MSKVQMPPPVACMWEDTHGGIMMPTTRFDSWPPFEPLTEFEALYTTNQMESYAATKTREALQSQDREYVAALHKALQALEAISDEMTAGDRFTNAGQYLLDALEPVREAIDHARSIEGEA